MWRPGMGGGAAAAAVVAVAVAAVAAVGRAEDGACALSLSLKFGSGVEHPALCVRAEEDFATAVDRLHEVSPLPPEQLTHMLVSNIGGDQQLVGRLGGFPGFGAWLAQHKPRPPHQDMPQVVVKNLRAITTPRHMYETTEARMDLDELTKREIRVALAERGLGPSEQDDSARLQTGLVDVDVAMDDRERALHPPPDSRNPFWFDARGVKRTLPYFIICGTVKGGTTAAFHYICDHPDAVCAKKKELWYFHNAYHWRGILYYSLQLPPPDDIAPHQITGEASPNYMIDAPSMASRFASVVPEARLIYLAREPVQRFLSFYNFAMGNHQGGERMKFAAHWNITIDQIAERELDHIGACAARYRNIIMAEICHYRPCATHECMVQQGLYYSQARQLLRYYPRHQVFVSTYEKLFEYDSDWEAARLLRFLSLPPETEPRSFRSFHRQSDYAHQFSPGVRARLAAFYAPFDALFFGLLREEYGWRGDGWLEMMDRRAPS